MHSEDTGSLKDGDLITGLQKTSAPPDLTTTLLEVYGGSFYAAMKEKLQSISKGKNHSLKTPRNYRNKT